MKYKKLNRLEIDGNFDKLLFEYFKINEKNYFELFRIHNQKIGYFSRSKEEARSIGEIMGIGISFGIWLEKNNLLKKVPKKIEIEKEKENENNLSMVG